MTRITIYRDSESSEYRGFCVEGHADYADKGEDIVCAAISMLSVHTQNAIEKYCNDPFDQEEDKVNTRMRFMLKGSPGDTCSVLLRSFADSITELKKGYPDYVDIDYREV